MEKIINTKVLKAQQNRMANRAKNVINEAKGDRRLLAEVAKNIATKNLPQGAAAERRKRTMRCMGGAALVGIGLLAGTVIGAVPPIAEKIQQEAREKIGEPFNEWADDFSRTPQYNDCWQEEPVQGVITLEPSAMYLYNKDIEGPRCLPIQDAQTDPASVPNNLPDTRE